MGPAAVSWRHLWNLKEREIPINKVNRVYWIRFLCDAVNEARAPDNIQFEKQPRPKRKRYGPTATELRRAARRRAIKRLREELK